MPWTSSSPSGLFTWLKDAGQFKDGSMTPCADGDVVHTWADQKNSNDAILLGGGYTEPTYHLALQNSLAGITFDGVGNALKIPNLLTGSKSHHVFIVIKADALVNAYSSLFSYGVTATSGGAIFVKSNGKTAWYIPNSFGSSYYSYDGTGAKTYTDGTAYIIEAKCDQVGGLASLYQNGDLDGSVPITGTIDAGNVNDGHILGSYASAGSDWPGNILEVLPYQGVLSDADRNIAGLYLANKWNISTAYTSAAATAYTLTGPTSGTVNAASTNFTVTPNGTTSGTVTPVSTGAGTFTPSALTWTGDSSAKTFTYTPSTTTGSPHSISITSSPVLAYSGSPIAYTVSADEPTPPSGGAGTAIIGLGLSGIF